MSEQSWQVLYGIPLPPSQVHRLGLLGKRLGPSSISVLVDHPSQLSSGNAFKQIAGFPLQYLVKVDTGYHRAGVSYNTNAFEELVKDIAQIEEKGLGILAGFYSHAGHSYSVNSSEEALQLLTEEIKGLEEATIAAEAVLGSQSPHRYTLSVGASPTVLSIENLAVTTVNSRTDELRELISRVQGTHLIELHAGVYPLLDLQQLATKASPSAVSNAQSSPHIKSLDDVALSILVEVASVYDHRNPPEALVAAGTLALGREPCKSYDGWGVVSDWELEHNNSSGGSGWKIGRISQEHSILTPHGDHQTKQAQLHVGQRLRIWPNHACVASAGFSWYLVIDSDLPDDRHNEIVDVWVRSRGW